MWRLIRTQDGSKQRKKNIYKMSDSEREFREALLSFSSSSSHARPVREASWAIPDSLQSLGMSMQNTFSAASTTVTSNLGFGAGAIGDDEWFKMSRSQRLMGFGMCLIGALVCFSLAIFTLPSVIIFPAKFSLTYTMGSLLSVAAFAMLRGPKAFFIHLMSADRQLFTAAYFGSMLLTLFAVIAIRNYFIIIICALIQLVAIVWYYVSYLPGGSAGMSWITRAFVRSASS
eukprot:Partr_v1_DN24473_c0_g1_i4_m66586 putative SFT2 domain containing